jgi:hypothetical protein
MDKHAAQTTNPLFQRTKVCSERRSFVSAEGSFVQRFNLWSLFGAQVKLAEEMVAAQAATRLNNRGGGPAYSHSQSSSFPQPQNSNSPSEGGPNSKSAASQNGGREGVGNTEQPGGKQQQQHTGKMGRTPSMQRVASLEHLQKRVRGGQSCGQPSWQSWEADQQSVREHTET